MKIEALKKAIREDLYETRTRPTTHKLQPASREQVEEAKRRVMSRHAKTIRELADM
ncbi:hypothetical protein JGK44_000704 [Shewanella algae]|uniref:hypothetical protein n=1 Tax=Shewanella algae TaxID=38313 RepID=UPI0031F4BE6B|nr:hypothetical protein [Shewanella algae]